MEFRDQFVEPAGRTRAIRASHPPRQTARQVGSLLQRPDRAVRIELDQACGILLRLLDVPIARQMHDGVELPSIGEW